MTIVIYSFQGVELVGNAAGKPNRPIQFYRKLSRELVFGSFYFMARRLLFSRWFIHVIDCLTGKVLLFGSFPMWAFRGGYLDDVGDLFCGGVGCEFGNLCQFANVMVDGGRPFRTGTF